MKNQPGQKLTKIENFRMTRHFEGEKAGQVELVYNFICPNCNRPHTLGEIFSSIPPGFATPYYLLECGPVTIVMPWAEKELR